MVNLNIIVEGQSVHDDMAEKVASNAASLRQAFNEFFTDVLDTEDIRVTIFMGDGYRNAARRFADGEGNECLYVDSDRPYDERMEWFNSLVNEKHPEKTITIPENKIDKVFFMVQEMEAWFLKQPQCIERWCSENDYNRKHPDEIISEHSLIRGKNIEDIQKPSEKLSILIRKYIYNGKKAVKYGKLTVAPGLIGKLDTASLINIDRELQRFKTTFYPC